ncbi:MAG TPA: undecaprenyl-diphosphate phosphatase [Bacillales bacterium]|nr:undecaprenyl-diphosphate phosphatase [Bacillales bacterium]
MELIVAVILGIVEGLTEFLPVSSTGHLILTASLLHYTGDEAKTFEIVIQLGSILAVVVVFWRRLLGLIGLDKQSRPENHLNLLHIILAMIPAVIAGLLFHDAIKEKLFNPFTVVIGLIAGSVLMLLGDKLRTKTISPTLDQISYKQAFTIGLFQCLALWPGFSRSGATISGGLLTGANHKTAAEFSFIVAVPIMFAASGYDMLKSWQSLSMSDIPFFVAGFVTAFAVAMLAIVFFLKLIEKIKLTPFVVYRVLLAAVFWMYLQ